MSRYLAPTREHAAAAFLLACLGAAFAVAEPVAPPRELPPDYHVPPYTLEAVALPLAGEVRDWGHDNLNVPAAWQVTKGKGVTVAVLDTGCDLDHRDLKDQIVASKDFTGSRYGADDRNAHGTWCCGAIAAQANDWGMVGVAPECKILVGKVLGDGGSGSVTGIAAGIRWAADNGADVISMSLGGGSRDTYLPPAIEYARGKGCIVVAAAGNSGPGEGTTGFPGGYAGVVCVAAHDANDKTARFSSRGVAVYVTAPGVNTRAPVPGPGDGLFGSMSGTSMATPYVAGVAANWVAANGGAKDAGRPDRFAAALKAACGDFPPSGRDTASGWGKPDAAKLVAGSGPVDPPPVPLPGVVLTRDSFTEDVRKRMDGLYPGWEFKLTLPAPAK